MRFLVAALIVWLFLFYNIERLSKPIDLTDVAYTFVPLIAALLILVPRLRKLPLGVVLVIPIPVFLVLKAWWKSRLWGASLPLTVTEVCVIVVTIILARWVSSGVSEFERAITHITIGQVPMLSESFSTGQAEMYQEVRRARHHQRPLALLAIEVEEESIQVALDRMVRETQQAMMKRYVMSDVARMLCDKLEDYDIIAQKNDHFIVLLPEVTSNQLTDLADQLRQAVSEETGVKLQVGTASFPNDAATFESLVKKAISGMDGKQKPGRSVRSRLLAIEQRQV
jgi:GGDEF domain-containing protein